MLYIYEYPTCSTCKKAKKLLTTHNIEATYFNVKEATPTVDTFKKIIETFNLPLKNYLIQVDWYIKNWILKINWILYHLMKH